jgi:hypothetical protein
MDELRKAIESLLADIEGMQDPGREYWFGEFEEYDADYESSGASIEWPNLAMGADRLRKALEAL